MFREDDRASVERIGAAEDPGSMAADVRAGLLGVPKDLSPWPKYLYDERGSELFEKITTLPEYYQTRAEAAILEEHARGIFARAGCRELVELGSGAASAKTRALLDAMSAQTLSNVRGGSADDESTAIHYVPLDVSESALVGSARVLLDEYPQLCVSGFVGDFEGCLKSLLARPPWPGGRLVALLGGTIGNFTPEKRRAFLSRLRAGLGDGDHVLIGVDLVKDACLFEAAYDDEAGVTAEFNKNLLSVLDRELEADFDPSLFEHRAFYDAENARVEMWLHSKVEQEVPVGALDLTVRFGAGEGMRTEISAKFTRESAGEMFAEVGLDLVELYTDPDDLFGLALGRPEEV